MSSSGGNNNNGGGSKYYTSSSLSRASSTGSLHAAGGENVSEDEDSDSKSGCFNNRDNRDNNGLSYRERRREAHTQAEQKRRDAIKKGYDFLQDLVPTCPTAQEAAVGSGGSGSSGYKVSKAIVLQKSIEYIQHVQAQKRVQEDELASLRKEVVALQIMRKNYEALAKAHKSQPSASSSLFLKDTALLPGEIKFQVFQLLMDSLFQSFNESVNMKNFSELSGCVFSWLEEQCKPQLLQELMQQLLCRVHEEHQLKKDDDNKRPYSSQS